MRVYFDTCVYNNIQDDPERENLVRQICDFRVQTKTKILFSTLVWEEFAHTKTPDRRRELFRLAQNVADPLILKDPDALCQIELGYVIHETPTTIFGDYTRLMSMAVDGKIFSKIPPSIFDDYKAHKKGFLKLAREGNQMPTTQEYIRLRKNIPYLEFRADYRKTPFFRDLVLQICRRAHRKGSTIYASLDWNRLPSTIDAYHEILCAMVYTYWIQGFEPRRGDNVDAVHIMYLGQCDRLVTSDE